MATTARASLRVPTCMVSRRKKRRLVRSHFRGIEGERFVFDRLMDYAATQQTVTSLRPFQAEIRRVTDLAYMGDFEWIESFRSTPENADPFEKRASPGQFRIHIEVKNVRSLGPKQMEKFERNVSKGWASGHIQGAICVNADWLDCLPGATDQQDLYLATTFRDLSKPGSAFPIVLVRDVMARPELLYASMDLLRQVVHSSC